MNNQEQLYIQGFNTGYTIAKYESSLLAKVVKNLCPTNDYLVGFFSGKKEFELEKALNYLHDLRHCKNREIDLNRDS